MQKRLEMICDASGLSPDTIAKRAGITVYDLIEYIHGLHTPSVKVANRLGEALGVTGAYIVVGEPRTICDRIKTIRFLEGYSLEEMGEALGLASCTIAKYETSGLPSLVNAMSYAERFGVSLDWMLLGKGEVYR